MPNSAAFISPTQYSDQQIKDAIAASRAQGYTDAEIMQGAFNNFGVSPDRVSSLFRSIPNAVSAEAFKEPSWVANAKQTIGTEVVPVYPMKTVHGGNQAEDTSAAPIGYKYDNGQSQYVYLDLAGAPTGTVENRGSGIGSQVLDMGKTLAPIAKSMIGANFLGPALGDLFGPTISNLFGAGGGEFGAGAGDVLSGAGTAAQLTPAAIESGLGLPGYGVNASAAASGLFDPATIGAGALGATAASQLTPAALESLSGTAGYGTNASAVNAAINAGINPAIVGSGAAGTVADLLAGTSGAAAATPGVTSLNEMVASGMSPGSAGAAGAASGALTPEALAAAQGVVTAGSSLADIAATGADQQALDAQTKAAEDVKAAENAKAAADAQAEAANTKAQIDAAEKAQAAAEAQAQAAADAKAAADAAVKTATTTAPVSQAAINQAVAAGTSPGALADIAAANGLTPTQLLSSLTPDALAAAAGVTPIGTSLADLAGITATTPITPATPAPITPAPVSNAAINQAVAAGTFTPGALAEVAAANGLTTEQLVAALTSNPQAIAAATGTFGNTLADIASAGTPAAPQTPPPAVPPVAPPVVPPVAPPVVDPTALPPVTVSAPAIPPYVPPPLVLPPVTPLSSIAPPVVPSVVPPVVPIGLPPTATPGTPPPPNVGPPGTNVPPPVVIPPGTTPPVVVPPGTTPPVVTPPVTQGLLDALTSATGLTGTQLAALLSGITGLGNSANLTSAINTGLDATTAANTASQGVLKDIYNQQLGFQKPYQQTGLTGLNQLGQLADTGYLQHQFNAQDLAAGLAPNYDFMLQQGQMANQRAANVGGGALSGNTLQGLQQYTQNYAGNAYQNAFNNYQTQRQNIYGNLAGMAGIGQTANTGAQAAGTSYGKGTTDLMTALANAQAAASIGKAQAVAGGTSGLANSTFLASLLAPPK